MTQEEKVALLKEAGVWDEIGFPSCIDKLIALVAAHEKKFWMAQIEVECNEAVLAEREACAKVCDEIERHKWEILTQGGNLERLSPRDCAQAIRERNKQCL